MTLRTRDRILAAAALAMPLLALAVPSQAQTRVNQNGGALDANTRVGSGGVNEGGAVNRSGQLYSGNQVVTGNVTGGREFRGTVNYTDPIDFRGRINRPSDRFVRDSARAPTRAQPYTNYGFQSTAYYGAQRATPPPLGFRPDGFSGGFIGVTQTTAPGARPSNPVYQRALARNFAGGIPLARAGDVVFEGGLDQNDQPTMLSASPLYGVRPLDEGLLGPANAGVVGTEAVSRRGAANRFDVDRARIDDMRRELSGAAGDEDGTGANEPPPNSLSRPIPARPIGQPVGGGDANLSGRPIAGNQITGSIQTNQSQQRRLNVPPEQQSAQYQALQQRFQQQQGGRPLNDVEANRQARMLRNAQDAAEAPAEPGAERRGGLPVAPGRRGPAGGGGAVKPQPQAPQAEPRPDEPATPDDSAPEAGEAPAPDAQPAPVPADAEPQAAAPADAEPTAPAEAAAAPLRITSLADGVEAAGLRDVLTSAEDLMRQGKFESAIQKYNTALDVAPNNPLFLLGRGHAELGATYYPRAERSLRQAIEAEPALLLGQYDLEAFMGRDRLKFLVQDLKQLASTEAGSPRPTLLLAYIAYNTPGSEGGAAQLLDATAERAGGRPDPLVDLMRKHWKLPAGDAPAPESDTPETTVTPEATAAPATPEEPAEAEEDLNK